jgi:hypothetical protein
VKKRVGGDMERKDVSEEIKAGEELQKFRLCIGIG